MKKDLIKKAVLKCFDQFSTNIFSPFLIFMMLAIFFLAGTLLSSFVSFDFLRTGLTLLSCIFVLFLAALANAFLGNKFLVIVSFCLVSFCSSLLYYSYFDWAKTPKLVFGQEMEISGKIIKPPQIDFAKQKLVVQINGKTLGNFRKGKINILVTASHFPQYNFGETLVIKGQVDEPQNIGEFDYKNYLKEQLIFGVVDKPEEITVMKGRGGIFDTALGSLYDFSNFFENSINRVLPEPQASLAAGILLGVKRNIPDNLINDLKTTSLTHIIALSGYNVTILVAVIVTILASYLGRNNTFYLGTLLIVLFVVMTGAPSSVVRAAIFSWLILFGKVIGRRPNQFNIILLTALLMVLVNPYVLRFNLGFQLSFLAFLGLIFLSTPIANILERWRTKSWPEVIKKPLAETLGAQIAVAPLILGQFGTVSLIAPISNLLVVWMVPWAMLFSFITGSLAMIFLPLGKIAALLAWPTLTYIISMVEWLAKIPLAAIKS